MADAKPTTNTPHVTPRTLRPRVEVPKPDQKQLEQTIHLLADLLRLAEELHIAEAFETKDIEDPERGRIAVVKAAGVIAMSVSERL